MLDSYAQGNLNERVKEKYSLKWQFHVILTSIPIGNPGVFYFAFFIFAW